MPFVNIQGNGIYKLYISIIVTLLINENVSSSSYCATEVKGNYFVGSSVAIIAGNLNGRDNGHRFQVEQINISNCTALPFTEIIMYVYLIRKCTSGQR